MLFLFSDLIISVLKAFTIDRKTPVTKIPSQGMKCKKFNQIDVYDKFLFVFVSPESFKRRAYISVYNERKLFYKRFGISLHIVAYPVEHDADKYI